MSAAQTAGNRAGVIELIYDGEAWPVVEKHWPDAKFKDASDFIHESRFEVEIPGVTEDEFYPVMIREGFGACCFGLMLLVYGCDRVDDVKRWLAAAEVAPSGSQGGAS